jgi:hypothetical protein
MQRRILEVGSLEVVGRGRSLRRPAGVAVSAGRAHAGPGASSSHGLAWFRCCGRFCRRPAWRPRPCAAPFCWPISAACCGTWATATGCATPCALRRYAADGADAAAAGLQPGAGALLRPLRLGVALVRRATGSTRLALAAAPILWTGLELAAARITSVPWDQLGYSQVDNALVNQLAPWTGVYGISFVLVAVNAHRGLAEFLTIPMSGRAAWVLPVRHGLCC